jgi:DNA repair exonuclease SbcCD nuclease subunit
MKIAFTADVHLVPGDTEHPERLAALGNVLGQLTDLGIEHLVIAGDLFDRDLQAYTEFETLLGQFPSIQVEIIPGNHDPSLAPDHLLASNITVYDQPTLVDHDGRQLLFVPFAPATRMGEVIERFRNELEPGRWILVGHGNYGGGLSTPHPHEPGVYMPLSRRDIDHSEPALVLLGHVHIPTNQAPVHYPGSPCGLDISETGRRQFLVLDTHNASVTPQPIQTDVIFLEERFVVLPADGEPQRLLEEIQRRQQAWNIPADMLDRVTVRIAAAGFCNSPTAIRDVLVEGFADFTCYDDGPQLDGLKIDPHPQLIELANRVREQIQQVDWDWGDREPQEQDALLEALAIVYATESVS